MASEKFDKRLQSLLVRHKLLSEEDAQAAAAKAKETTTSAGRSPGCRG